MLSIEAMKEREWGDFPELRRLLEAKPRSNGRYGIMSTSDNIFEYLRRLIGIADLANDHSADLLQAATDDGEFGWRVAEELRRLRSDLEQVRQAFGIDIEALSRLSEQVVASARNGLRERQNIEVDPG